MTEKQTMPNLILDNLKDLLTHWAEEMRKPAPLTDREEAEIKSEQAYRLENANAVKENLARKRQEQAVRPSAPSKRRRRNSFGPCQG